MHAKNAMRPQYQLARLPHVVIGRTISLYIYIASALLLKYFNVTPNKYILIETVDISLLL